MAQTESGAEKSFNTGEYTPGDSIAREPQTPAELAVAAGADLAGVLRTHFSHPDRLTGGGHLAAIKEFQRRLVRFEEALLHNAMEAKNESVVGFLAAGIEVKSTELP